MVAGGRLRVSGNSYASGANQNCGNVLSDVPSTRVAKPPGGTSSMTLGWSSADAAGDRQQQQSIGARGPPAPHEERYYALGPPSGQPYESGPAGRMDWGTSAPSHGGRQPGDGALGGGGRQPPAQPEAHGDERFGGHTFGQRVRESSNSYASGGNQNSGNVLTDVPTTRVAQAPGGSSSLSLSWCGEQPAGGCNHQRGNPAYGGGPLSAQQQSQDVTFGARPKVSSNSFANGADQNCGNVISDTPSTRVNRPPGGASSLRLGWD